MPKPFVTMPFMSQENSSAVSCDATSSTGIPLKISDRRSIYSSASFAFVMILLIALVMSKFFGSEGNGDAPSRPNIILILADDMGWNDVSFHGSPQIRTPNIDALASSSLVLHHYYAQPLCSPSRAALLTGKYPIRLGLQNFVLRPGEPTGLPLDVATMPQHLKNLGYATHIVGKWHLGYYKKEYTPTFRGFDSFFGFYNGYCDYYDYTVHFANDDDSVSWGVDLHNGTEIVKDLRGEYATDVYTQKGIDIIEKHNESQPLFLYMAYNAPHTGSYSVVNMQAPHHLVEKHSHIKDVIRKTYAGTVAALDDGIGKIFEALSKKCLLDNTIVIFSSDNGGELEPAHASNWPLRGEKATLWEGGVRVPGLLWSPLLHLKAPTVSTQLMHISDWLPTLYAAAGGDVRDLGAIDGLNMWDALVDQTPSPRSELLHNIDPIWKMASLRKDNFKMVFSERHGINNDGWSSVSGREDAAASTSMDEYVFSNGSVFRDILQASGWWLVKTPDDWRAALTVSCQQPPPEGCRVCDATSSPCLYDVVADPCEYYDVSREYPDVVAAMMERIQKYAEESVEPQKARYDPRSNPIRHGFAYVPWLDEEGDSPVEECSRTSNPEF